jgi:HPt (histidine-containing phosphotransfer) domain-containing protein
MTTSLDDPNELALHYLHAMLQKTGQNRGLAERLLKKLFVEMTTQLGKLEEMLVQQDMNQAKAIAHKLGGAASFCGFTDIQQLAKALEALLVSEQLDANAAQFLQLKQKITEFLSLETQIFQHLAQG